jgi:hypothetical protein
VLHGRTLHEMVTGNTPDISEYTDFDWYAPLWYYEDNPFPATRRILGRWLGVAHRVGQALCYWILTNTGQVIARTTVQALSLAELETQAIIDELKAFDNRIIITLGEPFGTHEDYTQNPYLTDIDDGVFEPVEPEAEMPEADTFEIDTYLQAQLSLPNADGYKAATVLCRKHDIHGNPVGMANQNPILDTRVYKVQFSDGHVKECSQRNSRKPICTDR